MITYYISTKLSFFKDQCYCCHTRLNGKSIQFAIRSQPFENVNIHKRPCVICRNLMSKQIEQIRQIKFDKRNLNEKK
jgi:hypothetical protein